VARFSGLVGFVHSVRVRPGVTQEVVTEKGPYFGDLKRASLAMQQATTVNTDIRTTNTVEIMADDEYVTENIFAIRFVVWAGTAWAVSEVTVQRPRLLLRLGGVWNGGRAEPVSEAETPDAP
jgi:hypothetical protein